MNTDEKIVTSFTNIAVLDIRKMPEEPVGETILVNVGQVLYSEETAGLIRGGIQVNVGPQIKVSPEATVIPNPVTLTNDYLMSQTSPLDVLVFAPVTIADDVTVEAVNKGLKTLDVYGGPLICPRPLLSAIQPKLRTVGKVILYEGTSFRSIMGKLILDEGYLQSLDDGSELIVMGPLQMPRVLDNQLLEKKVRHIYAMDGILCHEENVNVIRERLDGEEKTIKVIPAGFTLTEEPLVLDKASLESLKVKKFYCTEWIQIDPNIPAALFDQKLDALISEKWVFCPSALKGVIAGKCDWRKSSITLYEGELWLLDGEKDLPAFAFDSLKGKATLVVMGELRIAPEIKPELITEKIDRVHNLGSIWCTPEQVAAIKACLGLQDGDLLDTTRPEEPEKPQVPKVEGITRSYVNAIYVAL